MRVKILIEFEIEAGPGNEGLTEDYAIAAASQAAFDHLCLTNNGQDAITEGSVTVHVDGFGECDVSLGEDHQ